MQGSSAEPNLSELEIRLSYRTGRDNIVRDFFTPCLEAATLYRRAAGYFTSHGLALAARGVASLISRGGKMQLVVSPHLEPEDVDALRRAADHPLEILRTIAARSLDDIEDVLTRDRLNALAWLAATNRLEIKLALRVDSHGSIRRGIFHEKIGIFSDNLDNSIAFSGSANETAGGLVENFESIKVFCSWRNEIERVVEESNNFDALWSNSTPGLRIFEFSEISRDLIDRFRDPNKPPLGIDSSIVTRTIQPTSFTEPKGLNLRQYQKDAIAKWGKANGRGIFAMATGSGKTITALSLACRVAEKNKPFVLIVVCPFINLCQQWIREVRAFGPQPVACFGNVNDWYLRVDEAYQRLATKLSKAEVLVVTNSTFISDSFQQKIRQKLEAKNTHHMLIADEVHNLGAERIQTSLPEEIQLRLGLSATPERYKDPIGTQAVLEYFGGIIFEYSLANAINDQRLCRYRYHPIPVELSSDESDSYLELTKKLSRLFPNKDNNEELSPAAMSLLIKRARLIAGAINKISALDKVISNNRASIKKAIFYCGDGQTTDAITSEDVRQIQAVAHILGEKHGLRVRTFTYRETPSEREEILRDLSSGFLDGIVAIRCLDEGIDLPDLRVGFLLASSANPRQFIQRRGRLLRMADGKDKAEIYDFFVCPPESGDTEDAKNFNIERALFARELSRIIDFCETAENGPEALAELQGLRAKYNLLSK